MFAGRRNLQAKGKQAQKHGFFMGNGFIGRNRHDRAEHNGFPPFPGTLQQERKARVQPFD
jgi:hypothetical protein